MYIFKTFFVFKTGTNKIDIEIEFSFTLIKFGVSKNSLRNYSASTH